MQTEVQCEPYVRWMIRKDLPTVLEIESQSFGSPWGEDDFIRCIRTRGNIGMVTTKGDQVVGYMIYELHKSRLHLVNFAVDPNHRRQGIGTAMINRLKSKLSTGRRDRLMLEVADANLGAHLFFKAMGFKAISILEDFFDNPTCDAYLMRYIHAEASQPQFEECND